MQNWDLWAVIPVSLDLLSGAFRRNLPPGAPRESSPIDADNVRTDANIRLTTI